MSQIPAAPTGQVPPTPYASGTGPPHIAHPAIRYGGFWIRFLAYVIDYFVLAIPSFFIGLVMGAVLYGAGDTGGMIRGPGYVISFGLSFAYGVGMLGLYGWTVGMRVVGIRVTDGQSFGPLPWGKAVGRFFASILSGLILGIGYILIATNPEKRALHDTLAGTWVVYNNSIPGAQPSYQAQPYQQGYVQPPAAPTGYGTVSPDGRYVWDGRTWQPRT